MGCQKMSFWGATRPFQTPPQNPPPKSPSGSVVFWDASPQHTPPAPHPLTHVEFADVVALLHVSDLTVPYGGCVNLCGWRSRWPSCSCLSTFPWPVIRRAMPSARTAPSCPLARPRLRSNVTWLMAWCWCVWHPSRKRSLTAAWGLNGVLTPPRRSSCGSRPGKEVVDAKGDLCAH